MPCGMPRMTRGHEGSLLLSCKALASSIRRRFIPALPHLRCSADFGSKKRKNRANGEILTLNWRKWARIMRRRPNKAQAWLAHSKKVLSIPGFRVPGEAGTLEGRELLECWSHAPALVFTKPCSSLGFHEAVLQPWFSRSHAPALVFTKPCFVFLWNALLRIPGTQPYQILRHKKHLHSWVGLNFTGGG